MAATRRNLLNGLFLELSCDCEDGFLGHIAKQGMVYSRNDIVHLHALYGRDSRPIGSEGSPDDSEFRYIFVMRDNRTNVCLARAPHIVHGIRRPWCPMGLEHDPQCTLGEFAHFREVRS